MNLFRKICIIVCAGNLMLCGCADASRDQTNGLSFSSMKYNRADTFYCYSTPGNMTHVLDYESMQDTALCKIPNCKHTATDCFMKRLNGQIPVFDGEHAYYFLDDAPKYQPDDSGKAKVVLGSSLYDHDFSKETETKLLHVDASVSNICYGLLLKERRIYYIENLYSREADENGVETSFGNTGGPMSLHVYSLETQEDTKLCELYNPAEIGRIYPTVYYSGEVYMAGVYDNKLYFNVSFISETQPELVSKIYPTYYDFTDGSYHGQPDNISDFENSVVAFVSEDCLAECRNGETTVYRKGNEIPVELTNECFNDYSEIYVINDTLFCTGKVFDLNTKEVREPAVLKDKSVVAKYGDSYIISDIGMRENFEKISAEQLLK